MAAALHEPVGRDREGQPADGGRLGGQAQAAEPGCGREAAAHAGQEQEQVPREHRAEGSLERPEGERERPSRRVQLRLGDGLEAVGVAPRRRAVLELVARKPQPVDRLKVIACRRLPEARSRLRPRHHELGAEGRDRRSRGDHHRRQVSRPQAAAPRACSSRPERAGARAGFRGAHRRRRCFRRGRRRSPSGTAPRPG